MTISKTTLAIVTTLFTAWFFVDSYFAHATDLRQHKTKSQINNWSMEQSLNYMQQSHIKADLRKEKNKPNPDQGAIDDLEETRQVLKTRGAHLQNMQDEALLHQLKETESKEVVNIENVLEKLIDQ